MIQQHLHFNVPDNVDAKIWRYLSLEKLERLLSDKSIYFCRSDLFEDKHEGSYTARAKEYRKSFYAEASDHWINETMPNININLKKCTYISCWHVNENEDIHMWQSYEQRDKAIAITSKISKIKEFILDTDSVFLLGPVNYIDYKSDLVSEANAFAPFFCKRKEFASEREFRILKEKMVDIDAIIKGEIVPPKGCNIPVDVSNLIDNVICSPFSDNTISKNVSQMLAKYGMLDKLSDSSLITDPIY